MQKETVRLIARENGFNYKTQPNGAIDLNPYVFDFADALQKHILAFEPSEFVWEGVPRLLGRYMQAHDRYCPASLYHYLRRSLLVIPDFIMDEINNHGGITSTHAFPTATLPVIMYKAFVTKRIAELEGWDNETQ